MQFQSNKGYTPVGQFGMLLLFTGLGFIVAGLVQAVMLKPLVLKGGLPSTAQMRLILEDPAHTTLIRWMQAISTFFLFCVPAILFSLICNGKKMFWLGFNKHLNIFQVMIGFAIIFIANIAAGSLQAFSEKIVSFSPDLSDLANQMEKIYSDQVKAISHFSSPIDFTISLVIMAFLPALFEELFFRGALQQVLVKWLKHPIGGIIITSLVFSLIHSSIHLFLSRALLGFVLGLIFYYTKNIWVNIIAHFLNNAVALIQLYYLQQTNKDVDISKMDMQVSSWISLLGLFAIFGLFKLLKKHSENNKLSIYAREQALLVNEPIGQPLA
jgi:membrane protease YdiL (CAAX protease family)